MQRGREGGATRRAAPPPAREALWVTRGRQVTVNGGCRLRLAGGWASDERAGGGRLGRKLPGRRSAADCGVSRRRRGSPRPARHGQSGGGRSGLRGRRRPRLGSGRRPEAPLDSGGRPRRLAAAQRGDPGQVSGTRTFMLCRVPTPRAPRGARASPSPRASRLWAAEALGPGDPARAPSAPPRAPPPKPGALGSGPGCAPGSLPPQRLSSPSSRHFAAAVTPLGTPPPAAP